MKLLERLVVILITLITDNTLMGCTWNFVILCLTCLILLRLKNCKCKPEFENLTCQKYKLKKMTFRNRKTEIAISYETYICSYNFDFLSSLCKGHSF